ncbi:MAG TPA: hypothetical protein PLC80_17675 [Draconibacterium sp.]|nr:hypothetical protein [Draconibacterium sp.]
MKREDFDIKLKSVNRTLLFDPFFKYIEQKYFKGAMDILDDRSISFEFENFKSYCFN